MNHKILQTYRWRERESAVGERECGLVMCIEQEDQQDALKSPQLQCCQKHKSMMLLSKNHKMILQQTSSKWRKRNEERVCVGFLPAYSKTTKKLVAEGFSLGYCTQASVVHLLSIQLHSILREVEPFLNNWCQLSNPPPLLSYKFIFLVVRV